MSIANMILNFEDSNVANPPLMYLNRTSSNYTQQKTPPPPVIAPYSALMFRYNTGNSWITIYLTRGLNRLRLVSSGGRK